MKNTTIIKVRASGFKVNFLAEKIGVNPAQLTMALNGRRPLPIGKEEKLIEFLSKIPA